MGYFLPIYLKNCISQTSLAETLINNKSKEKIKKNGENISLELSEKKIILSRISKRNFNRPHLVIGFAAETEKLEKNAKAKLLTKGCDWILANNVSNGNVFNKDENKIIFISKNKIENWNKMSKDNVAVKISNNISDYFKY